MDTVFRRHGSMGRRFSYRDMGVNDLGSGGFCKAIILGVCVGKHASLHDAFFCFVFNTTAWLAVLMVHRMSIGIGKNESIIIGVLTPTL